MKIDPKTGARYAHSPEEWAEVIRKHGAGMTLPASVAARIGPALRNSTVPRKPAGVGPGRMKDK